MYTTKKIVLLIVCFLSIAAVRSQNLEANVDRLLNEKYEADKPGATALIAKGGKVIYKKAFGMANLELNVPMNPDNVFEIGSITKQFTAVSILMLMEQGKLNVEDDITKYIPDYPTKGKKITIHHLLNHTSGIKSYTNMPSFMTQARTDMTPLQLIDVFKDEEMEFEPGEEYSYNNSAFIILGHIIELVSEMSYEDFVEKNIFQKLGMNSSQYGSKSELIKNRASGYQPTENGYQNADYLSMSLPYAAGSLMSNVEDMLLWEQAVHNNTLVTKQSIKKAFTNYTLNNGDPINYGYGWSINEINGTPTIEHGGGIFGYTTYAVYEPKNDVYVVVLTNSNGNSPTDVSIKIAAHAIGKPYPEESQVNLTDAQKKKWVGTYEFEGEVLRFITLKDGQLFSQREGSTVMPIVPVSENHFNFVGSSTQYKFSEKNGKRIALFKDRINEVIGVESTKKPASEKESLTLDAAILKKYVGVYELQPGFTIEISAEGSQIFAQATGQPLAELFAESETKFFLKVANASVVFNAGDSGEILGLTLHQGGQKMPGKKIK